MGVEKFMDASIGYITREDTLKLLVDPKKFPTRVIPHEFGWWINVPEPKLYKEDRIIHRMREEGYSEAFIKLLKLATKSECWWINLDCDGTDVEGLKYAEYI